MVTTISRMCVVALSGRSTSAQRRISVTWATSYHAKYHEEEQVLNDSSP